MPPKKEQSKKNAEKQKQKVVEDKTFGLKNKKGSKQQKFIQQVHKQVSQGNKTSSELAREKLEKREAINREKEELNELFKPVLELQKCAQGFVLKRDQKKIDDQKEVISLDELIEKERFEKMEEGKSAKLKREADFKQGRTTGISGREIFEFNPNLITESAEEFGEGEGVFSGAQEKDDDEYNGPLRDIDFNTFTLEEDAEEQDTGGDLPKGASGKSKLETKPVIASTSNGPINPGIIDVDEDLFDQADLDELENELEELEIEQ